MSRLIFMSALFLICCKQTNNKNNFEENTIKKTIGVDFASSYDKDSYFTIPESISFFFHANPKKLEKLDSIRIINPRRNSNSFLRKVSLDYKDSTLTYHFSARNYYSLLGLTNRPHSVASIDSLYRTITNLRYIIGSDTLSFNTSQDKVHFYFMNNDHVIFYERNQKFIIKGKGMILDTVLLDP